MSDTHNYRHTLTGKVAEMTDDAASVFPEYLQRVADDAKPFVPGLFKPGKVGEFDNPEPLTDEQITAAALVEATGKASRSKAAREAKAEQKRIDADAAAAAQAARLEQEAEATTSVDLTKSAAEATTAPEGEAK